MKATGKPTKPALKTRARKTVACLLLVAATVVLFLALVSFYHVNGVLALLHFETQSRHKAALSGSRQPGLVPVRLDGAVSVSDISKGRGVSSGSDPDASSWSSQHIQRAGNNKAASSSATECATNQADDRDVTSRFTRWLMNRHIIMGTVEDRAAGTLRFFPSLYNLQFTPPQSPGVEEAAGIRMGKPQPPEATQFTTVEVADDLFTAILRVATDKDWQVHKRNEALERAEAFAAYGGSPVHAQEEYDYVDGGVPPEPSFHPLSMRLRSSKHCRVVYDGADLRARGVAHEPVGDFDGGRTGAFLQCHISALLRPNPLSGDGNGRAALLPGMSRNGVPPDKQAAQELFERVRCSGFYAPATCCVLLFTTGIFCDTGSSCMGWCTVLPI